jgi:hypothetical protein
MVTLEAIATALLARVLGQKRGMILHTGRKIRRYARKSLPSADFSAAANAGG